MKNPTAMITRVDPGMAYKKNNYGKLYKWVVTLGPDVLGYFDTKESARETCKRLGVLYYR